MPSLPSHRVVNIADLRRLAKRRLPRIMFDYIDGGADAEVTMRGNSDAFNAVTFRPRCAVATESCNLRATVLGSTLEIPLLLGPVGSSRMFYPHGEAVAAHAAGAAGTVYTLSTLSGSPVEEVKAASEGPVWCPAVSAGRPRRGARIHRPRARRGLLGARSHDRHAGRGAARA